MRIKYLFIYRGIEDIHKHVNPDVTVCKNNIHMLDISLNCSIDTDVFIGFIYVNTWKNRFPFNELTDTYFSDKIVDKFLDIRKIVKSLTIDLITCSVGGILFIDEFDNLKDNYDITVRYSSAKMGSYIKGGNWILDSHGVDIKNFYFDQTVDEWIHILDSNTV